MISKSEQELLFMVMELESRVRGVDMPNLAYVDMRVSANGIWAHPAIFPQLQEIFKKKNIVLTMIVAKKAAQTWFRFRPNV